MLIRDVCSGVALMEVLVFLTRKNKLFHARVYHVGLETDVKLDWVIITCYALVLIARSRPQLKSYYFPQ